MGQVFGWRLIFFFGVLGLHVQICKNAKCLKNRKRWLDRRFFRNNHFSSSTLILMIAPGRKVWAKLGDARGRWLESFEKPPPNCSGDFLASRHCWDLSARFYQFLRDSKCSGPQIRSESFAGLVATICPHYNIRGGACYFHGYLASDRQAKTRRRDLSLGKWMVISSAYPRWSRLLIRSWAFPSCWVSLVNVVAAT